MKLLKKSCLSIYLIIIGICLVSAQAFGQTVKSYLIIRASKNAATNVVINSSQTFNIDAGSSKIVPVEPGYYTVAFSTKNGYLFDTAFTVIDHAEILAKNPKQTSVRYLITPPEKQQDIVKIEPKKVDKPIVAAKPTTNTQTTASQNIIAKLKFEDAQEAFTKADYETALNKLNEAEKLIGQTSPQFLHLRIKCQYQLVDNGFDILQALKKNCDTYIAKYQNNTGIETQFREVYKISEAISKYPSTKDGYATLFEQRKSEKIAEEAAKQAKGNALLVEKKLITWGIGLDGVNIGMLLDNVPNNAWNYLNKKDPFSVKKGTFDLDRDCIAYSPKYSSFKFKSSVGLSSIMIDKSTNKVFYVAKNNMVGGKSSIEESKKVYDELAAKFKQHFGADNVSEQEITKQIDKNSSFFTKTATLKVIIDIQYSITQTIIYYGGILGTECKVTETFTSNKGAEKK
ncbi:MAG: hypothetical protein H7101_00300 [Deinococcales bacterium]|nr:hypothetical protein [Chitinophagaceae bacterium]